MDEVVVISSESSTEYDGELPASTGLILHSYEAATIPRFGQLQVYIYLYGAPS